MGNCESFTLRRRGFTPFSDCSHGNSLIHSLPRRNHRRAAVHVVHDPHPPPPLAAARPRGRGGAVRSRRRTRGRVARRRWRHGRLGLRLRIEKVRYRLAGFATSRPLEGLLPAWHTADTLPSVQRSSKRNAAQLTKTGPSGGVAGYLAYDFCSPSSDSSGMSMCSLPLISPRFTRSLKSRSRSFLMHASRSSRGL